MLMTLVLVCVVALVLLIAVPAYIAFEHTIVWSRLINVATLRLATSTSISSTAIT